MKFYRYIKDKSVIHPIFFLFFAWFAISGKIFDFFVLLFSLFIHEFGHYFIAKKLGYKLNRFQLMPFGAELDYSGKLFDNIDEIKIALAGPCANFGFSILLVAIWWLSPSVYNFTQEIFIQNIILGLINLLPAYPLDGGRVLLSFLENKVDRKNAIKFLKFLNLLFSLMFIVCFVITCFVNYNPSFALMGVFILSGSLEMNSKNRYELVGLIKNNKKNFRKVEIRIIDEHTKLLDIIKQINYKNDKLFYLSYRKKFISEEGIISLTLKNSLDKKIEDLV